MFNYEFDERFAGRYFGKYRGWVEDIQDPKGLFRIKAVVPSVMGPDDALGWAFPTPITGGGNNVGDTWLPAKGDYVWIEFEGGDPSAPVWSAGPWAIRGGGSTAPKHARGVADMTDYSVRGIGNTSPTQFQGEYGHVRTIQGHDGSFLEFDGTPSAQRLMLSHFSGSRIEMFADGGVEEVCIANNRKLVTGVQNVRVGARDEQILGIHKLKVDGITEADYAGNVTENYTSLAQSGKSFTGLWGGDYRLQADSSYSVQSLGNGALSFTGQLSMLAGANMQLAVMEDLSISASKATTGVVGTQSATPSINVHGYNGTVEIKSTDVSGIIQTASLVLDAGTPGTMESIWEVYAGTSDDSVPFGQITLNNSVAPLSGPNVMLGSSASREPLVLGETLVALLKNIIMHLKFHAHPTGTGMSGPAADPGSLKITTDADLLLLYPKGTPGGILSGYSATS